MSILRSDKQHFYNSIFISALLVLMPVLIYVFEWLFATKFDVLAIFPRDVNYLHGIITHVLVHADFSHLANNVISLFILSTALFYFYGKIADKVLVLAWLLTGAMLWSIGRPSFHVGASGLIFALAFFLFLSGTIRKHAPLIALALIVVFWYGSMVWHIFPWEALPNESWEGHLSGAIVGTALAVVYRKEGPQRPIKVWEEELTEEEKDLAEYAESFELEGEERERLELSDER